MEGFLDFEEIEFFLGIVEVWVVFFVGWGNIVGCYV